MDSQALIDIEPKEAQPSVHRHRLHPIGRYFKLTMDNLLQEDLFVEQCTECGEHQRLTMTKSRRLNPSTFKIDIESGQLRKVVRCGSNGFDFYYRFRGVSDTLVMHFDRHQIEANVHKAFCAFMTEQHRRKSHQDFYYELYPNAWRPISP